MKGTQFLLATSAFVAASWFLFHDDGNSTDAHAAQGPAIGLAREAPVVAATQDTRHKPMEIQSSRLESQITKSTGSVVHTTNNFFGPLEDFLETEVTNDAEGLSNELEIMDILNDTPFSDRMASEVTCSAKRCSISLELADSAILMDFVERYAPKIGGVGMIRSFATGDERFGLEIRVLL